MSRYFLCLTILILVALRNPLRADQGIAEPTDAIGYKERADSWREKKEFDKAIADYTEAIRLDSSYVYAYRWRGISRESKGEYYAAIADYSSAIRLDPKDANLLNDRAISWRLTGNYDSAIADDTEAIRLNPEEPRFFSHRAGSWMAQGEFEKAIADHNAAIELDPKNAKYRDNRADCWTYKGQYEKAIADYREAIQIDPKRLGAYNSLAWLQATCYDAAIRNGEEAIANATKACELSNWKDGDHIDTLAAAFAESGQFEKAVHWQTKAFKDLAPKYVSEAAQRLALYQQSKPYRDYTTHPLALKLGLPRPAPKYVVPLVEELSDAKADGIGQKSENPEELESQVSSSNDESDEAEMVGQEEEEEEGAADQSTLKPFTMTLYKRDANGKVVKNADGEAVVLEVKRFPHLFMRGIENSLRTEILCSMKTANGESKGKYPFYVNMIEDSINCGKEKDREVSDSALQDIKAYMQYCIDHPEDCGLDAKTIEIFRRVVAAN